MSDNTWNSNTGGNRGANRSSLGVWVTWTLMAFIAHSIGAAIFMGTAAVFLGISFHTVLVPYTALAYCGVVLGPLVCWARLARARPKPCAIRFTVAMFLYSQTVMMALGFGIIRLGILPFTTFVNDYAPFLVLFFVLCSVPAYLVARQMLEATNNR